MNHLEREIDAGEWILLTGPPGTGKTARTRQAGDTLKRKMFYGIDGRTADLMDRLDIGGAIWPNHVDGVADTLPLRALQAMLDYKEPAIWFVDEIGRAPLDVQGGLCSLMDRIRLDHPNFVVCAATNRPQDKAGVMGLSEQLRSRFDSAYAIATPSDKVESTEVTFLQPWSDEPGKPNELQTVLDWMQANNATPEIIAWHRATTGRTLYTWHPLANPAERCGDYRAWATVMRKWNKGFRDLHSIGATVGKPIAAEFLAFAALRGQVPSPQDVYADPTGCIVPDDTEPAALFMVCSMLASAATKKTISPTVQYTERLPRLFAAYLGRDLFRTHQEDFAKEPKWIQWLVKNQGLFNVGGNS